MINTPLAADTRATLDARYSMASSPAGGARMGVGALEATALVRPAMPAASHSSEDGDTLSSVSRKNGAPNEGMGLRDRLLHQARSERQRCLEVAEAAERRRAELRGLTTVAVQTDPVFVINGPGSGDVSPIASGSAVPEAWGETDEQAQQEALRTIQMLGSQDDEGKQSESKVNQLEEMMHAERAGKEELDMQLANERAKRDAAQQQVLCLEYELDGKEAALQVAERALERRDADLKQAQSQLRALQEDLDSAADAEFAGIDDAKLKLLRQQIAEREQQLEQKDAHISRLLSVLRQQHSEEASPHFFPKQ